jgi:hypothetical protein
MLFLHRRREKAALSRRVSAGKIATASSWPPMSSPADRRSGTGIQGKGRGQPWIPARAALARTTPGAFVSESSGFIPGACGARGNDPSRGRERRSGSDGRVSEEPAGPSRTAFLGGRWSTLGRDFRGGGLRPSQDKLAQSGRPTARSRCALCRHRASWRHTLRGRIPGPFRLSHCDASRARPSWKTDAAQLHQAWQHIKNKIRTCGHEGEWRSGLPSPGRERE